MVKIGKRTEISVPLSDGSRVTVPGYVVTGDGSGLVIHRAPGDARSGWRVTHAASGLRLPSEFATREGARAALEYVFVVVPDASGIMDRIASRSARAGESQRLADAWREAIGGAPLDPFAALRREIRDRFGDWDALSASVLSDIGAADDGWTYAGDVLTCPHGHMIEDDGRCPSGCVSPFVAAGII